MRRAQVDDGLGIGSYDRAYRPPEVIDGDDAVSGPNGDAFTVSPIKGPARRFIQFDSEQWFGEFDWRNEHQLRERERNAYQARAPLVVPSPVVPEQHKRRRNRLRM